MDDVRVGATVVEALQSLTMFGCVGMGVLTPFNGVGAIVNVGVVESAAVIVGIAGSGDDSGSLNASTQ